MLRVLLLPPRIEADLQGPTGLSPLTLDLVRLRFAGAVSLGQQLRTLCNDLDSQQMAAQRLVQHLYATFREPGTETRQTALIRCFQTRTYAQLPPARQAAARAALGAGAEPAAHLRCLTLLGTVGELPAWNVPAASAGHLAIPLPNAAVIGRTPMIAGLFRQMGVNIDTAFPMSETPLILDADRRTFNVFHVENAEGSELIPAQQTFVLPHGIRSVVGMGGLMPSGELFAVVLFAKVHVSREVAELFRTLALSVKLTFLRFSPEQVLAEPVL